MYLRHCEDLKVYILQMLQTSEHCL